MAGDKRILIVKLLKDPHMIRWSDGRIAAYLGCSQPYVSKVRRSVGATMGVREVVKADGLSYELDVTHIGTTSKKE